MLAACHAQAIEKEMAPGARRHFYDIVGDKKMSADKIKQARLDRFRMRRERGVELDLRGRQFENGGWNVGLLQSAKIGLHRRAGLACGIDRGGNAILSISIKRQVAV